MFLIFVNDLDDNILSRIWKFVDGVKLVECVGSDNRLDKAGRSRKDGSLGGGLINGINMRGDGFKKC